MYTPRQATPKRQRPEEGPSEDSGSEDDEPQQKPSVKPAVPQSPRSAKSGGKVIDNSTRNHFKKLGLLLSESATVEGTTKPVRGDVRFTENLASHPALEAIIKATNRPSLVVQNGTFADPAEAKWRVVLNANKARILKALRAVGRVECDNFDDARPFLGTAWMVTDKLAITNTHVARVLLDNDGSPASAKFPKPIGRNKQNKTPYRAFVNFNANSLKDGDTRVAIKRVLYAAPNWQKFQGGYEPDMALLELDTKTKLPDPIPLSTEKLDVGSQLLVIGYPAKDASRNPLDLMEDIFKGVYNVKRVAPGDLMDYADENHLLHDASTLGGNSGSVVFDMYTGTAVGLHYAGQQLQYNIAVTSTKIRAVLEPVLKGFKLEFPEPESAESAAAAEGLEGVFGEEATQPDLSDRPGYNAQFLGKGPLAVPLPSPTKEKNAVTLKYLHHSVIMNKTRKLAWAAASNIDGELSRKVARKGDTWWLDPRIPAGSQVGREFYKGTSYDRGHLSRREDTAWGDDGDEAFQGQLDTFFYTNSAPQWWAFNQQTWLGLENYILENVRTTGTKACVFTGPVFSDDDPPYNGVQVPLSFWKVVATIDEDGKGLHCTGYLISQGDIIGSAGPRPGRLEGVGVEGLQLGAYKTFQVPIGHLEQLTGISFGPKVLAADPLKGHEEAFPIESLHDVRF